MPRVDNPFDDDLVKDQLPAPVRNTFVHFDEAPAFPSGFHRLHTCPAEVGMSYFFEKIGRSPVVTPAVGSRCPTPKFIQTAEQKKTAQDVPEAGEQREEQEDSVVLGEFFTVKKGKKRAGGGIKARLATMKLGTILGTPQQQQQQQQPPSTEKMIA